jgi:plastocyanin
MKKIIVVLAALAIASLTLAACGGGDDNETTAATTETTQTQPAGGGGGGGGGGAATTDKLSADASGLLKFDTDQLDAKAGKVTIDFTNPAQIQHDVAVAKGSQEIAKSPLVAQGSTSVATDLAPGKYVFYCTVPGHREAGMEGTLTVK